MSGCCEIETFNGMSSAYRRALIAVIVINAVMCVVEATAGFSAGSQALKADALDFAGDTATYALSFYVIGASLRTRAKASLVKGASLAIFAVIVLGMTGARVLDGSPPEGEVMGFIGVMALVANLASVFILLRWRDGDSNVRSVWLCSRNDAIGNVGVIVAGLLVASTGSHWPDIIVAALIAGLFLKSSLAITAQALSELKHSKESNVAVEGADR